MQLVEQLGWVDEVIDGPIVKADISKLSPPESTELTFVGVRHSSDPDTLPDYLGQILDVNDILLLEGPGWGNKSLRNVRELARGSRSTLSEMLGSLDRSTPSADRVANWSEAIYRQIYGSKIRVGIADIAFKHPLYFRYDRSNVANAKMSFDLELARDLIIAEQIGANVQQIRTGAPELIDKTQIRAIALYGAAHYAVRQMLEQSAMTRGVDSFKSSLLFEEHADMRIRDVSEVKAYDEGKTSVLDYHNWMRTP